MTRAATENARRTFSDYYLPKLHRAFARVSKERRANVLVVKLSPGGRDGVAECLTEQGDTVVWPWMDIEPVEGTHWRAITVNGTWALDDQVPLLDLTE